MLAECLASFEELSEVDVDSLAGSYLNEHVIGIVVVCKRIADKKYSDSIRILFLRR